MKSHSLAGDVTHARLFINYHNQPEGKTHELTVYDAFMYLNAGGSNYDYKENSTKIDSMNTGAGTMVFTYDTQPNREADIVKITIDRPDGLREITDITYDAAHNITQTKETKDVKGAEFDASGQAVSQTIDGKEGLKTRTISKITDYEYEDRGIGKGGVLKSVTVKEEVDGQVTATAKQRIDYAAGHKLNDISVITDENSGLTKTYDYENRFHNVLKSATGFDGVENKLGFNTKNLLTTIDSGRFGNTYEYDGGDRLASIESNGTEYAFQYDDAGMLEESEIAGNPIAAHTYDERRRLKQTLYANGDMGGYKPEYDDKTGFLTNELFWDEGPAPSGDAQFSYLYDNSGLLTQVSNRELLRTTNYGYDVSGRLADILTTNNGNAQALVQQSRARLKYNNHGALDNLTVTANDETLSETTYSYDELGRPLAAELDALGGSLLTNTYASLDRLARQTLILPSEDMVATNYTYLKDDQDVATGFVSEMETVLPTSDEQFKFGYEWDGTNIKKITENGNNAEAQVYFYDAIGQLVRENDLEYVYDDGGNLAAIRDFDSKAVKHKFEYEKPWKDQLTKYDGKPLTYDKLGNLKSYDGVNYTWEKGGLLTEINGNGQDVQYAYDHSGLRSKKIVDGKTTEFIWAGEMLMAQITEDYTIAWSYDSSGKMIGFTLDSVPYFYIRNLMGDVTGIMDAGGALVARYTYDAWGNILRAEDLISAPFEDAGAELDDDIEKNGDDMEDPNVDSDHENDEFEDEYVQYSIAEINPIRYRGYYRDAETEYYYCQSRYYNPEWRRWISADIFFDTGMGVLGTNMYAYCNNNPVMYVDPTGSALLSDILGLVDSLMQFWDENRDWIVPAVNLAIVGFVGFWAFVGISAVGIGALTYFVGIPLLNMARDRLRDYRDGLPEPTTDGEKFLHGALKFADGLLSDLIVTAHIVVVASIVTTVTSAVMSVAGITAFGVWNVFVGIMDTAWLVWDKFRMEIDGGDDDDEINALSTQAAARGIAVQAAANTTTIDLFRIVTAKNTKINLTLGNTRNLEITLTQTVSASISGMYLTGYDNEKWGLSDGLKATKGKVRVEGSRAKGWSLRSIAANGTGRGTLTLTATVYYS
jgi:RHS repeat-associated protein